MCCMHLNKPTDGAINITYSETDLTIQSPYEGEYMTMAIWCFKVDW